MPLKGGWIEVKALGLTGHARPRSTPIEGKNMGGIGKKGKLAKKLAGKDDDKAKKPPPAPIDDDDIEDGDIATPKRDRYGDDDQPL
jgi:hypothetical protein